MFNMFAILLPVSCSSLFSLLLCYPIVMASLCVHFMVILMVTLPAQSLQYHPLPFALWCVDISHRISHFECIWQTRLFKLVQTLHKFTLCHTKFQFMRKSFFNTVSSFIFSYRLTYKKVFRFGVFQLNWKVRMRCCYVRYHIVNID